jgi:hypothetical protein
MDAKKTRSWPRLWKFMLKTVELKSYQKSPILAERAFSDNGFQAAFGAA